MNYLSRHIVRAFYQHPWSYSTRILQMIKAKRMLRRQTSQITRQQFWITRRRRQTFHRICPWSCSQIRCWWRLKTNAFSSAVGLSTALHLYTLVRCCAGAMVAQAASAMATTGPSKTQSGSKPSPKRAYTSRLVGITTSSSQKTIPNKENQSMPGAEETLASWESRLSSSPKIRWVSFRFFLWTLISLIILLMLSLRSIRQHWEMHIPCSCPRKAKSIAAAGTSLVNSASQRSRESKMH